MGQNKGNLIASARYLRALGIILVACGYFFNLRATRCDRSQLLEGIPPDLKLVGGYATGAGTFGGIRTGSLLNEALEV